MTTSPILVYENPEPMTLEQALERQERIKLYRKVYLRWKRREEEREQA